MGERRSRPFPQQGAVGVGVAHRRPAQLAAFVGREGAFANADSRRLLEEAIDERLWRHRTPPAEWSRNARVPVEAVALHQLAEQLAR